VRPMKDVLLVCFLGMVGDGQTPLENSRAPMLGNDDAKKTRDQWSAINYKRVVEGRRFDAHHKATTVNSKAHHNTS